MIKLINRRFFEIAVFILLFTFYFLLFTCLYAGGIATTFTGMYLENLSINTTYNLRVSHDCPLKVINNSPGPREIVITPKIPQKDNLKENYEPLPDLNWIFINPERYQLGPNQTGSSDIILIIPKDKKLRGRKFQVNLDICGPSTEKSGGMTIVPSLLAKLRFSIEKKKKRFLGLW